MNLLDMRTLVLSNVLTDLVCVWFVVMLWRQSRNRFTGTAFWVFDFVFQTVALILIILRGAIPDWMSMVLSNALVIAGAILGLIGLERFFEKKSIAGISARLCRLCLSDRMEGVRDRKFNLCAD